MKNIGNKLGRPIMGHDVLKSFTEEKLPLAPLVRRSKNGVWSVRLGWHDEQAPNKERYMWVWYCSEQKKNLDEYKSIIYDYLIGHAESKAIIDEPDDIRQEIKILCGGDIVVSSLVSYKKEGCRHKEHAFYVAQGGGIPPEYVRHAIALIIGLSIANAAKEPNDFLAECSNGAIFVKGFTRIRRRANGPCVRIGARES